MGFFDRLSNIDSKKKQDDRDVAVTESLLEELPDNFLGCRDLRHAWSVDNDFYVYENPKHNKLLMVSRELVCMRCNTTRQEIFIQRKWGLEKISNHYNYADGYQLKGVPRGVKPSNVVHDVLYKRAMQKVAEAAREGSEQ